MFEKREFLENWNLCFTRLNKLQNFAFIIFNSWKSYNIAILAFFVVKFLTFFAIILEVGFFRQYTDSGDFVFKKYFCNYKLWIVLFLCNFVIQKFYIFKTLCYTFKKNHFSQFSTKNPTNLYQKIPQIPSKNPFLHFPFLIIPHFLPSKNIPYSSQFYIIAVSS
jgi:hypothetical protein